MPDDVSFRISAPGSTQTEEQLRRLADRLKSLEGDGKRAGSGFKELGRAMGTLRTMAGAIGVGLSIQQTTRFMSEAMAQNRRYMGSLQGLAGQVGGGKVVKMLDEMQAALDYEIDRTTAATIAGSMLTRSQFMTADSMATVSRYAKQLAQTTGTDLSNALAMTGQALGALKGESLDSIGIHIDEKAVVEAAAKAHGKKAQALDEVTRKQALYNAVIAEMQRQLKPGGGAGDPQAQMAAAWQDIRNEAGSAYGDFFGQGMSGIADVLRGRQGGWGKALLGGNAAMYKALSGVAGIFSNDAAGALQDRAQQFEGFDSAGARKKAQAALAARHVKIDKLTVRTAGGPG